MPYLPQEAVHWSRPCYTLHAGWSVFSVHSKCRGFMFKLIQLENNNLSVVSLFYIQI